MTYTELYNICHDEAVAYANSEQWSKRTGKEKSFLIQGYLDAMMEMRKSEITEKKKEYPKTFNECLYVLEGDRMSLEQMNTFRKLIDSRNAYWKIAGEEMGLGKPWEPTPDTFQTIYVIRYIKSNGKEGWDNDKIDNTNFRYILSFPTEEMRDAFYENFKELINSCKELL